MGERVFGGTFRWAEGDPVVGGHGVGDPGVEVEADHVAREPILGEAGLGRRGRHQDPPVGVDSVCAESVPDGWRDPRCACQRAVHEERETTVEVVFQEEAVPAQREHGQHETHVTGALAAGREDGSERAVRTQEHDLVIPGIENCGATVAQQYSVPDGGEHVVGGAVPVPVHRFRREGEGGFGVGCAGVLHDPHPRAVFDQHFDGRLVVATAAAGQRQRQQRGQEEADYASARPVKGSRRVEKSGNPQR